MEYDMNDVYVRAKEAEAQRENCHLRFSFVTIHTTESIADLI